MNREIFCSDKDYGLFWFRIFGYGAEVINTKILDESIPTYAPKFTKQIRIGRFLIKYLPKYFKV